MKVLYLCHGRNHEKLKYSKYATTIDGDIRCNPDIVIDLIKNLNTFDKIIKDNTYDLIEMRFPYYKVIINNDRLINLCYKKLKVGGKLHINNLKIFILRDNYKVKYINSIISKHLDYKNKQDKITLINDMNFEKVNYNSLIIDYLKDISFNKFEYNNKILNNCNCLLINGQYYRFNNQEPGVTFIK